MTNPQKPRWTAEERREARTARRIESRGALAGTKETRHFRSNLSQSPTVRSAPNSGNLIQILGTPIVYSTPYVVFDSLGSFEEQVLPGALTAILPTCDCRFLFDHKGLCLARTVSQTLTLTDSPQALNFAAGLDPRQSLANDLVIAIERGDISQMSFAFIIDPAGDHWNGDFSKRTISKIAELLDVSAVTYPASPTTEIFLDDPVGGPDGTQGGNGPDTGMGNEDGTGSRSASAILRMIQIDQDRMSLWRPPAH